MIVHLLRHGEVANPNHVVYGDLDGFNLSATGVRQAHAAARWLGDRPVGRVITSPLARAVQTATAVAIVHDLLPILDHRLVETRQFPDWTGLRWDEVRSRYPVELASYIEDASTAPVGDESIEDVADRIEAAVEAQRERLDPTQELVCVSHQDPTQAVRLRLTGRDLSTLRVHPPPHASVITLESQLDGSWLETATWQPGF